MSLTQSGNVFYERSKTAVQAAEHALSVNEENQGLQGKIRIAAPYSAGESLLMPALLQLQNEHPELQVDVIFNDRVINPVTEGVDLSLRLGDVSEGFLSHARLAPCAECYSPLRLCWRKWVILTRRMR
ncbi:FIG00731420: hypothetical protein [Klebsiella pneumoniae IS46]|nr:FIG00731420: hypothetical protein [Klebsiella pneumoniae IS46]